MEFLLLDQDLCESKVWRNSNQFKKATGKEIANLMYLYTLSLYILSQDKAHKFARTEAGKTVQYSNYALFRSHASDMYFLAYQILHPDNDHADLKNPVDSKRFLNRLKFKQDAHITFLRQIQNDTVSETRAEPYLFRLESQLQISDTRYKTWRRNAIAWAGLNNKEKQRMLTPLVQEFKRLAGGTARNTNILNQLELLRPKRTRSYRPLWAKDTYDKIPGKTK